MKNETKDPLNIAMANLLFKSLNVTKEQLLKQIGSQLDDSAN